MSLMDVFVKIGADTSELESGVKKSEGLVGSLGKGFGTAMKVAGAAVAGATTAVAGFAAASVKVGASFDSAMSQVAATLGFTVNDIENNVNGAGETFDRLREKAREMGGSTIYSAQESAEALNILAMSGFDAEQSISMVEDVLHLAAAGSMDMASAAGFVSGAMKGFADDTKDAQYYADLMSKGATLASTSVAQLGDAISGGAASAAAYGQSADSMTVALLRLAEQGEVGSAAGTALAAAMKDIYTGTDQAKAALQELGVDAYDPVTRQARDFNEVVDELEKSMEGMTDEEKNSYKQTIFGIQGLNAYNKMVVTGIDKQNQWKDALAGASEGAGEAAKQYDTMTSNFEGAVKGWESALSDFQIEISDKLKGSFTDFVSYGTSGLQKITAAFQEGGLSGAMDAFGEVLSGGLAMVIDKLPTFIDAGMQLLGAVGQGIISNLPLIIDAAVKIAVQLTDGLAKATPQLITGAIAIITALASALIENAPLIADGIFSAMKAAVNTVAPNLSGVFELLFAGLSGTVEIISEALSGAIDIISSFVEWLYSGSDSANVFKAVIIGVTGAVLAYKAAMGVAALIMSVVNAIKAFNVVGALAKAWITAATVAQQAWNVVMSLNPIGILIAAIAALVAAFIYLWNTNEDFRNFWIGLWEGIKEAASVAIDSIIAFFTETIPNALQSVIDWIKSNWQSIVLFLINPFAGLFKYFYDNSSKFREFVDNAINNIKELPTKIAQIFLSVIEKVETFGRNFGDKAREKAALFLKNMVNGIVTLPSNLWNIFTTVISKVVSFANDFGNKAREAATSFVNNLINGITALPSRVANLAGQLVSAVSSLPSKFAEIGSRIVDGLWSGIKGGWDWLKDKVSNLADSLFQGAKDALGIHSPSRKFKWIGQMIDEGLASGIDKFSYLVDGSLGDLGVLDYVNTAQPQLAVAGNYGGGGDYNQTINIYSPTALTPSEVARQTRNATRDMVLELRGKR